MALSTFDFLVHPAEGVASFIVVEFGNGAYRLPTGGGVAIFAGNVERAVGIPQDLLLRSARGTLGEGL